MNENLIKSVDIYARGKNRDVYGNPYYAWLAIIKTSKLKIIIPQSMDWGNSYESAVVREALQTINRELDIHIEQNDPRVNVTYKHAKSDDELRHPENWKIEL